MASPGRGLDDAALLYCAQVHAETAALLGQQDDAGLRELAEDARARAQSLGEREHDLLNDAPARYSRASATAQWRLAALPETPGRARSIALRTAYEECQELEDGATAASGNGRVQMLAQRRFCRDLLLSKLRMSPAIRAALSPSELAALDETRRIGDALAQPLPGPPPTLEQDREANQLTARWRSELDQAVAGWSSGTDPIVQAMGQCYEDYVQARLGGPDVLSAAAAPAAAMAEPEPAKAPVVRPAELGAVFHMREATPAGSIDGIWFRRGRSNVYDAIWVQAGNGQMQRDVLELRGIVDGELTIHRQGFSGSYRARVRPDGTLAPGSASWFDSTAYSWGPLPSQPVRGASLGAIVHMREVTPQGNYEGIWRQRGQTGVYDVIWVFLPTGEITADVLAVTGVAQGRLVIRRLTGPALFSFKRRADGPASARGGRTLSKWEVLPAQPVRLGRGSP